MEESYKKDKQKGLKGGAMGRTEGNRPLPTQRLSLILNFNNVCEQIYNKKYNVLFIIINDVQSTVILTT